MYKEKLGISADHELVRTGSESEKRKGRDTDIYNFDEKNTDGEIIARYVVRDSMSVYPRQSKTDSFIKYDLSGAEIESGTI